jgi:hypothetical protein
MVSPEMTPARGGLHCFIGGIALRGMAQTPEKRYRLTAPERNWSHSAQ